MSHSPQRVASVLATGLLACAALGAVRPVGAADDFFASDAQTPSPITDHFSLRASFVHDRVGTELRLDPPGKAGSGTLLSGMPDLGFRPSENDGLAELMFRLRDRNRINFGFMELDQSGKTTLPHPVVFGDQVFNKGDVVSTTLQWRVMNIAYTYSFIQNDRFELGAGLGVEVMDLDVRGVVPARFASYETSTVGGLPTPVLQTALRITRRISVTARAQYLHVAHNGTSGAMTDVHADAQFRLASSFSIGAGYSLVRVKLETASDSDPGLLGLRVGGPELFVRASF